MLPPTIQSARLPLLPFHPFSIPGTDFLPANIVFLLPVGLRPLPGPFLLPDNPLPSALSPYSPLISVRWPGSLSESDPHEPDLPIPGIFQGP